MQIIFNGESFPSLTTAAIQQSRGEIQPHSRNLPGTSLIEIMVKRHPGTMNLSFMGTLFDLFL